MDRGTAGVVRGLYDAERAGEETFAWTRGSVTMDLPGVDRHGPWSCTIRVRGGRPNPATSPDVVVSADGVALVRKRVANDYQDLTVEIPPRPQGAGLVLTLAVSNTFEPGPTDRRALGVIVDRWRCAPATAGFTRPPSSVVSAAMLSVAVFGVALALGGVPPLAMVLTLLAIAGAQSVPLTKDLAPFSGYAARVTSLAVWIAALLAAGARLLAWRARGRLHPAARYVLVFSAAALYLKLAALLHPSKLPADVLFHVHRLEWVLGGRWYFTQPLASGLEFPYAIGLYAVAAPWTLVAADSVVLLRTVVSSVEALGGAMLYLVIVRSWGDRLAGAVAVTLFHCVPLVYGLTDYAILTNLFAQGVSLVTMCLVAIWPLERREWPRITVLALLAALAFLSHVSTFALLSVTLVAVAAIFRWRGGAELRSQAGATVIVVALASIIAVASYYGHFGDVYARAYEQLSVDTPADAGGGPPASRVQRSVDALDLTAVVIGWPILSLAAVGAWRAAAGGATGRLALVLGGWGLAYLVFLGVGAFGPVDRGNERYAAEFVNRVVLATYPAAIVLAAIGSAWWWRAGGLRRIATASAVLAAVWLAVRGWLGWLQ